MPRTFRLAVLLGLFVLAGLAFPSVADAQRRGGGGGGGARGTATVRGGGAVVRGGGVYRGTHVAVPRTHHPYSYYRPYYSRPYYRPYYSGYYPRYYSPWSFSLSFGFGYGGYYAPFYAYPYYASPYVYSYAQPYPYAYPNPSPSPYPAPASDNGYNTTLSTQPQGTYRAEATTAGADERGAFGTLSIRVMPSDATILIDQLPWDRPRGDDRFSIELVEGPHHVEIRKAGYATYVRTIDVPRGRAIVVNVALAPGGTGTVQVARTVPFRQ
jgi:hypothetical protein